MASTVESKLGPNDFNQFLIDNESNFQKLRKEGIDLKEHVKKDNILTIASFIERFQKEKGTLNVWRVQVNKINDIGFEEVRKKGDAINDDFENFLKDVIIPLFDETTSLQLKKTNHAFISVIDKLKTFRAHRSEETHSLVDEPFGTFKNEVFFLSGLSKRCSLPFNKEHSPSIHKIKQHLLCLEKQVDIYALSASLSLAYQFQFILQKGLPDDHHEWTKTTSSFDQHIQQLSKQEQVTLDHKYYELSPGQKGGREWGKLHRWDNLGILNDALLRTIREIKEKEVFDKVKPDDLEDFYLALHEVAFGPTHTDPVAWAKREFPYLVDLIPVALEKMQEKKK